MCIFIWFGVLDGPPAVLYVSIVFACACVGCGRSTKYTDTHVHSQLYMRFVSMYRVLRYARMYMMFCVRCAD